jgi:hypothetical protein
MAWLLEFRLVRSVRPFVLSSPSFANATWELAVEADNRVINKLNKSFEMI